SFIPDKEILKEYSRLDEEKIRESIEIRSYINAGVKFIYNGKEEYFHEKGIKELVEDRTDQRISDVYYFSEEDKKTGNLFEISLTYCSNSSEEDISSFANGIRTTKGTHESGFRKGITDAMKNFISKNKMLTKKGVQLKDINGEDVRSGLSAVINIRYDKADYSAQTKDELTNPELFGKITSFTKSHMEKIA